MARLQHWLQSCLIRLSLALHTYVGRASCCVRAGACRCRLLWAWQDAVCVPPCFQQEEQYTTLDVHSVLASVGGCRACLLPASLRPASVRVTAAGCGCRT